jgi:hypothetical protein
MDVKIDMQHSTTIPDITTNDYASFIVTEPQP